MRFVLQHTGAPPDISRPICHRSVMPHRLSACSARSLACKAQAAPGDAKKFGREVVRDRFPMSGRTLLLIVLVLLLFGALPTWPYSTGWGYYPSGGLGLLLLVVVVLALLR